MKPFVFYKYLSPLFPILDERLIVRFQLMAITHEKYVYNLVYYLDTHPNISFVQRWRRGHTQRTAGFTRQKNRTSFPTSMSVFSLLFCNFMTFCDSVLSFFVFIH